MNIGEFIGDVAPLSLANIELAGLSEHTAEIQPGYGFIGVAQDSEILIQHCLTAQQHGALVCLVDSRTDIDIEQFDVPVVKLLGLAQKRGELAAHFYGDPSREQVCVGITGTNGKTSIGYHIADLSARLGVPTGYSGTLGWGSLENLQDPNLTTGDAVSLQRRLADMKLQGMNRVALEVSSHALDQDRAAAVRFDYGVFSNLTRDHLDYHHTYEAYAAAKTKLFTQWPLKCAVVNIDDEFGRGLATSISCKTVTYGEQGDWSWEVVPSAAVKDTVVWKSPAGEIKTTVTVVADYALSNIAASLAVLGEMGHRLEELQEVVEDLAGVPGRMEIVGDKRNDQPLVIVDYAHTPDALEKVLRGLRRHCAGRLVCVVGCGGDRDVGKRPLMGKVAATHADLVWLTSDNPRSESPVEIIADIRAGITQGVVWECVDRAEAIYRSIREAGANDIVLIAGKGHEDYQEIEGQRFAFDDRHVAQSVLVEMH
ncbi:MAG: UDP-N-acetylmuramoyl-L-alanyl-D-glutamate--2,6-diaminopimelate ligase [Gammaproteobacteria bacterium]|nr:UDP-N-acetylmuramoyl-L-alanyl-D-glutamate--2,6-diaminopimelate ligase [Gammaproteobacteria bacterium]